MPVGTDSPTVGVVGGGQLGRMLGEAAAPLGIDVVVVDPTPDPPAAPVVGGTIVGAFDAEDAIRALAERVDVLTYEIELADPDLLATVAEDTDVPVHPSPDALRVTGDKLREKRRLSDAGLRTARFEPVAEPADVTAAADRFGYPLMLKARRGGYDGRGNVLIEGPDAIGDALAAIDGPALVEEHVAFDRELAVMVVRNRDGVTAYPAVETVHEAEILRTIVAPARTEDRVRERARRAAREVAGLFDGRGVFGVECFEVDGEVLINEIAPRPHNSGHYTIEGAHTSQFEQHLRAAVGYPTGACGLRGSAVTVNVLGSGESARPADLRGVEGVLSTPGANLHWYGKREVRPLRKMGHVTCVPTADEGRSTLLDRAERCRDRLTFR